MVYTIAKDVTVEVSEKSALCEVLEVVEYAKKHIEWLETHSYEDSDNYDYHRLSDLMRKVYYDDEYKDYRSMVDEVYWDVDAIESRAYRDYAEDDLLEYATHMDEPDFDWGFYSDWHKDVYGFRPRR